MTSHSNNTAATEFHSETGLWLLATTGYWLLNVFFHQVFSLWLVATYTTPFGEFVPRDHALLYASVVGFVILITVVLRWQRGENRLVTCLAWLVLTAIALTVWQLLTTVDIELIHYPQYAGLGWLLARTIDPERKSWPLLGLAATGLLLGVLDELNQYFFLTPVNNTYVDFNDFTLNLVGCLGGLLLYYGFQLPPQKLARQRTFSRLVLLAWGVLSAVVAVLTSLGRLQYTPTIAVDPGGIVSIDGRWIIALQREAGLLGSWLQGFSRQHYYVSGMLEWIVISAVLLSLPWLFRFASQRRPPE